MQVDEEFPSRDLAFEWGRTAPGELSKVADAIDTKLLGVFAAASVIIGVTTALVQDINIGYPGIPFAVSFAAYALILVVSLWGLWPRQFPGPSSPKMLREYYWKLEPDKARVHYLGHKEKQYNDMYPKVRLKGRLLSCAVPLLGVEVIFLILWLLVITIS